MSADIGVIGRLTSDSSITALVTNRVYPYSRPQKSVLPAISVRVDGVEPHDTKDGASELDEVMVAVIAYGAKAIDARNVINEVRNSLDRYSGTQNGVVIQSIRFEDEDSFDEQIINNTVYNYEHIYKVRLIR